ncbi:class I adenylate-forming enzyme family protein [Microbulbifer aggregans]|uniref:class I adenylate-forming enzyme family protein n=1 Tax=Microbulbifer aggregans TaxID=1769779 RepID=UPI001CFCFBF7|nr:class I adenylate-forming enzyme family protein [Microbulbifer aggregans]
MTETLVEKVALYAGSLAEIPAISDTFGNDLTYSELWAAASGIAGKLQEIRENIDFAFVMANRGPLQAIAILAARISGVPLAIIDIRQGSARIASMLNQGNSIAGIVDKIGENLLGKTDELEGLSSVSGYLKVELDNFQSDWMIFPCATEDSAGSDKAKCVPDRTALIIYTSGSTGNPKGVCIGESDLDERARVEKDWFGIQAEDCVLGVLPINFDVGLTQLLGTLFAGGHYVFSSSWFPADILKQISLYRPCGLAMSPMIWKGLLKVHDTDQLWGQLNTLRYVTLSGGPLPLPDLLVINQNLKNTVFVKTYGQTEMFRIASCKVVNEADLESVGGVYPGVEISITDDSGQVLPSGREGNIQAQGLGRMLGYVGEVNKDIQSPVVTGDVGYLDDSGRLVISGRKSDMLKILDQRVFPQDVANTIKGVLNVSDVVVLVSDASGSSDPVLSAVVEMDDPGLGDEQAAKGILRQRLASHIVPRNIYFIEKLPETLSGKIDIPAVRDIVERIDRIKAEPVAD